LCAAPAQNWDGSGGNDAAIRHYEATGRRYPLAVKLGTVTPHGADVYSYAPDENDMVLDPKLVGAFVLEQLCLLCLRCACNTRHTNCILADSAELAAGPHCQSVFSLSAVFQVA